MRRGCSAADRPPRRPALPRFAVDRKPQDRQGDGSGVQKAAAPACKNDDLEGAKMTKNLTLAALALALGIVLSSCSTPARSAAAAGEAPCERACLSGLISTYLSALVSGDASHLPVTVSVRFTEDQEEKRLGREGLWARKVSLTGYRFDILDVRAGIAASLVKVQSDGMPTLLALRLLTQGGRIAGIESIAVRSRAEGMIFEVDAIQMLSSAMALTPPAVQRDTRRDLIDIASHYPRGLQSGSFVTVDAPFTSDAYRFENGRLMAGPGCTFFPGCQYIKTQRIPTLSKLVYRIAAVDEEQGVVLIRMDFGPGSVFETPDRPKGQSLSVFEAFKVYGGQIHAVEAFMKTKPAVQPLGWE
jgi:hypothetical protein